MITRRSLFASLVGCACAPVAAATAKSDAKVAVTVPDPKVYQPTAADIKKLISESLEAYKRSLPAEIEDAKRRFG
jgi:ABC-type Zn uptake system ZnuABC Zn-binding protein ZnuA